MEGGGAAVDADGVWGFAVGGEVFFEGLDIGTEAERAAIEVAGESGIEFGPERLDLGWQIEVGDGGLRHGRRGCQKQLEESKSQHYGGCRGRLSRTFGTSRAERFGFPIRPQAV